MSTPLLYPGWIEKSALELIEYPRVHPSDILLFRIEFVYIKMYGRFNFRFWTFFLVKDYFTSYLSHLTDVRTNDLMDMPIKKRARACQLFKARGEQFLTVVASHLNIFSEEEAAENCRLELLVPGAEEELPSGFYERVCWFVGLLAQRNLTETAAEFIPWSAERHVCWTQDVFDQYFMGEFLLLEGISCKGLLRIGARGRLTRLRAIVRCVVVGR